MVNVMDDKKLLEFFNSQSNCYADTEDDSVVMAMTADRFIESIKKLNGVVIVEVAKDVGMPSLDLWPDLCPMFAPGPYVEPPKEPTKREAPAPLPSEPLRDRRKRLAKLQRDNKKRR